MQGGTTTGKVLFEAIAAGKDEAARALVAAEPGLAAARNDAGVSAVMVALYHRRADLARDLAARVPALDAFEAAALGATDRLAAVLAGDAGAARARSSDGFTALHLASFFGRPEAASLLIASGADVDAVAENPMKVRPLHSAAAARSLEIVTLLVARGADVNARQQGGFTALQAAAMHGDEAMTKVLLSGGADPRQAADDGRDAIAMARAGKHERVVALLAPG